MNEVHIAGCWCGMTFTVSAPAQAVGRLMASMTKPHEERHTEHVITRVNLGPAKTKSVSMAQRRPV